MSSRGTATFASCSLSLFTGLLLGFAALPSFKSQYSPLLQLLCLLVICFYLVPGLSWPNSCIFFQFYERLSPHPVTLIPCLQVSVSPQLPMQCQFLLTLSAVYKISCLLVLILHICLISLPCRQVFGRSVSLFHCRTASDFSHWPYFPFPSTSLTACCLDTVSTFVTCCTTCSFHFPQWLPCKHHNQIQFSHSLIFLLDSQSVESNKNAIRKELVGKLQS